LLWEPEEFLEWQEQLLGFKETLEIEKIPKKIKKQKIGPALFFGLIFVVIVLERLMDSKK
jgi:hypothetical protein